MTTLPENWTVTEKNGSFIVRDENRDFLAKDADPCLAVNKALDVWEHSFIGYRKLAEIAGIC